MTMPSDPIQKQLAVQAACQRVRAETMAMQKSDDLLKVIAVLFEEMKNLGSDTRAANIFFVEEDRQEDMQITAYLALPNPRKFGIRWDNPDILEFSENTIAWIVPSHNYNLPDLRNVLNNDQPEVIEWMIAWRKGETSSFEYPELQEEVGSSNWAKYISNYIGLEQPMPWDASPIGRVFVTNVPFKNGVIGFHEFSEAPDLIAAVEELAKALDLGYMRFLDFQRLEAQNRELEIDRALERVRAEIAAMRRTDDSEKAVRVLGEELQKVSIDIDMLGVIIFEGDRAQRGGWTLTPGLEEYVITTGQFTDDLALESIAGQLKEHWRRGEIWQRRHDPDWVRGVVTEANNKHGLSLDPEAEVWVADVPFTQGTLAVNRGWYRAEGKPFTDDEQAILKRFAEVVALGYARFADFQQLETQNRALAREAAVERIRAEAGAMLQSDDLHTVVSG